MMLEDWRSRSVDTDEKIRLAINDWRATQSDLLERALAVCQSPIESLFMMACIHANWWWTDDLNSKEWNDFLLRPSVSKGMGGDYSYRLVRFSEHAASQESQMLVPQLPIVLDKKRFFIDFAFWIFGYRIAVELDGHEFHEKTKEQARTEKSRQRLLTEDGWHVLRFTGSEVYADATKCLLDVECLPIRLRLGQ